MTHQPADNQQLARGLTDASAQSAGQHADQMHGMEGIEATQVKHSAQLQHGDDRMDRIEAKLDANTSATEEVLEIMRLGKAFFKLAEFFGNFLKWATAIGAPVIVFWYTLKNGGKP